MGRGRYRFEAGTAQTLDSLQPLPAGAEYGTTCPWPVEMPPLGHPILVELIGARVPLTNPENWIGSDPACGFCRADDPFVEPQHVRLCRDANGAWSAQNNKSPNGL